MGNQNFQNASPLGFWIATTIVIIITIFAVVLAGATPSDKGIFVQYLTLTLELALVSGSCVGLLQSFLILHHSSWAKVRWFGITMVSTVIGWCIVFVFESLLAGIHASLINLSDKLVLAIFYGFLNGASMGAIVGLVTGIVQGRIQSLSAHDWIVGNIISWSIGVGTPLAVFFAVVSKIRLF